VIERVPSCGYQRFYRRGVYQVIDDYFKLRTAKRTSELYEEFERSERCLFADKRWMQHFDDMCESCGLEPSWVRRRINQFMKSPVKNDFGWVNACNLAERILGLCEFTDTLANYKKRGRKIKLVKLASSPTHTCNLYLLNTINSLLLIKPPYHAMKTVASTISIFW